MRAFSGRALLRGAAIACLFATSPGHGQAVDPARLALGRQVIAIMYPPERREASWRVLKVADIRAALAAKYQPES